MNGDVGTADETLEDWLTPVGHFMPLSDANELFKTYKSLVQNTNYLRELVNHLSQKEGPKESFTDELDSLLKAESYINAGNVLIYAFAKRLAELKDSGKISTERMKTMIEDAEICLKIELGKYGLVTHSPAQVEKEKASYDKK